MTDLLRRTSLQSILAFDAATCALMGVFLASGSELLSTITLIPAPLLLWAGLVLLPIAVFMAFFARTTTVPAWAVLLVVLGNVLWALGSVALPVLGLIFPNAFGWLFLLAQAAVVAVFAVLEWSSRRRLIPA